MTRTAVAVKKALLFLAASVLTTAQGGRVLEFAVEPTDTVVEAGQSAVLDCVAKTSHHHQQSLLTQWLDQDGVRLNFYDDAYRSQLANGSLYINNVMEDKRLTGRYQCLATVMSIGTILSRSATLSIAKLSGFLEEPRDLSVFLGQRAHFACSVDANPLPKIKWLKDERPLQLDELRMTVLPSGALEIDEVIESDQGSYRCNVSSFNRNIMSNKASLIVDLDQEQSERITAPSFTAQPRDITTIEGQNVSLDCAANGNPQPAITWLKDGYQIDLNDLDSRFNLVGSTKTLRIVNIRDEDRGTYQCKAENREDTVVASASVVVNVPPKFLKKPEDKTETSSNNVELECEVYGNPKPKIQWYKNGETVIYNEYYKNINGNNLKIMGLMTSDSGIFQCFASNIVGNVQASAVLKVVNHEEIITQRKKHKHKKYRPQSDEQSLKEQTFFSLKSDSSSAKLGDVDFGHSAPHLSTNNNNNNRKRIGFDPHSAFNALKSSDNLGDVQSAFSSPPLTPSAGNSDGKFREGVPGAPQDLRALMIKAKFVILSWKPPEVGDNIEVYTVFYKQEGVEREMAQNTSRSKLEEISIQQLTPGKVYHFRVVGINSIGAGKSSDTLTVTTQTEEHVASAPLGFEAFATSENSIRVSWRAPSNPNGVITGYTVYYMEVRKSLEHKVDTMDEEFDLTNLTPYTEYSIWVEAVNQRGPGVATEEKLVRTFGDKPSKPPSNVTLEPSSTSIAVRWEPPPPESQNGPILGYHIRCRKPGKPKPLSVKLGATPLYYLLTELDRDSIYQCRLWASNLNGTSPPTDWIETRTFENDLDENIVPGKPGSIKIRPTDDSLYVSWTPPENQSVRVRNYILGWGKGIPDMYSQELDEKNRTFCIKGLDPNSEYVISLRASNQMGTGPPIYGTAKTQEEQPEENLADLMPPMGLKAQILSASSVVLYWTDPTLSKNQNVRPNMIYMVKCTPEKSTKSRIVNATDMNILIDDLKPNTMYDFSVKLVKGRRESPWSMVVQNRTWELAPNVAPSHIDVHFTDSDSQLIEISWQPPKMTSGRITGYVILYTDNQTKSDPEWEVLPIKGDQNSKTLYNLKPFTKYYFKVQARNSRGYGPFSSIAVFTTGEKVATMASSSGESNDAKGIFSGNVLWYLLTAACLLTIVTVIGVLTFMYCRKKDPTTSPDRNKKGYQKGNLNVKPPDLWIHHDQMELKNMEKRHSNNDGASSSGAMTLPRSVGGNDYDNHDGVGVHTNSLDKRTYIPNYCVSPDDKKKTRSKPTINLPVDSKPPREPIATPVNTTLSQSSSESTPSIRPTYPRTQYSMPRPHVIEANNQSENLYSPNPVHQNYEPSNSPGYNMSVQGTHVPPHIAPGGSYPPGLSVLAESQKRMQGQGHPLKSFTVPAPPPISAPGTPQPKHIVTVRPNTSPFKKAPSVTSSPGAASGTPPSRISACNPPPHTPEEVQRLHSSHSTEELNQEMANLEGLMLTLNAITANEFEC